MGPHALPDLLHRLRRRVLLIDGAAGFVWGLTVGTLWLLAGVWLDLVLELSGALRVAILGTTVAVALAVFLRKTIAGMARGAAHWMARRLDEVAGTGGQILSGVDLVAATSQYDYSADPGLTSGLAQLAVKRATQLAHSVPQSAAVPVRPVKRSAGSLGIVLCVAALAVLLMPRLAATEWRRFADPFGDHVPFSTTTFVVEPG